MFFSTKQGLARIKAFYQVPMRVYTVNSILFLHFNSCQTLRKDDSCDSTMASCVNFLLSTV